MASLYPISHLCQVLQVPRSSYYAWSHRPPSARARQNQILRAQLARLFVENRRAYGSPRLAICLQRAGIPCSRNRVARQMQALELKARQKRAFRPKTTDSRHGLPIAQNRLAQAPPVSALNRVWVSDITYVFTLQGWLYLAAVMDLYSRRILGWATADHLKTSLVQEALQQATQARSPDPGLIHHSDRGSQYASSQYRHQLLSLKALPSMSAAGHCFDNAAMESFWSSLKTEALHHHTFTTHHQARLAVFDYIETFYNPKRLHSALNYHSPLDFERINNHA